MKKIVVAPDSFKGSLTASEFAGCCRKAIHAVLPDCAVVAVPLGDGGEGTLEALTASLGGSTVTLTVRDPLMRPVDAPYGISADGKTAVIEMARASGLPLLAASERNPMITTSYGTGELIADALDWGCTELLVCIGGSATCDCGTGMLSALGARFHGDGGEPLQALAGGDLDKIRAIDLNGLHPRLADARITVACDVDNPLCGPCGAAAVFAPQKGATPAMVEELERGLTSFARVIRSHSSTDVALMPGAGAAGGLGAAFAALLGATLRPGIDMVLDAVDFDALIAGADLVITGEGRIDDQTLMGKTPYGVLRAARRQSIPVVALGGSVAYSPALTEAGFAGVFSIQTTPMPLDEAMKTTVALDNLGNTVSQLVSLLSIAARSRKPGA